MGSTVEKGHAKNVGNFDLLKKYCASLGNDFNPSRMELQFPYLSKLLTSAKGCLKVVKDAKAVYHNATNEREIAFMPLRKLFTKIGGALIANGGTEQALKDVRALIRKVNGKRAKPLTKPVEPPTGQANTPVAKTNSVSQQGFDNQLEHFEQLIAVLATLAKYKPNEPELTVVGLTQHLEELKAKNSAASDAETELNKARVSRNEILYGNTNSVMEIANSLKAYIKSVYGAASPQFRKASSFTFSKIKQD